MRMNGEFGWVKVWMQVGERQKSHREWALSNQQKKYPTKIKCSFNFFGGLICSKKKELKDQKKAIQKNDPKSNQIHQTQI